MLSLRSFILYVSFLLIDHIIKQLSTNNQGVHITYFTPLELHSRAMSSEGGTSPFPRSQHRVAIPGKGGKLTKQQKKVVKHVKTF